MAGLRHIPAGHQGHPHNCQKQSRRNQKRTIHHNTFSMLKAPPPPPWQKDIAHGEAMLMPPGNLRTIRRFAGRKEW